MLPFFSRTLSFESATRRKEHLAAEVPPVACCCLYCVHDKLLTSSPDQRYAGIVESVVCAVAVGIVVR